MRDFRDAKAMATSLRQALTDKSVTLTHSESLELIAKSFGLDNWNILAARIEAGKPAVLAAAEPAPKQTLNCSFCGKSQYDVATLIAGPTVFICDQCVGLCDGILVDKKLERDLAAAQIRRPDAPALEAAADALHAFTDGQIEATLKSCGDWLEHIDWSLAQAASALAGEPRTPWRPDARAIERGWAHRDPLQGKSRAQIEALQTELQARQGEVRARVGLLEQILAERRA